MKHLILPLLLLLIVISSCSAPESDLARLAYSIADYKRAVTFYDLWLESEPDNETARYEQLMVRLKCIDVGNVDCANLLELRQDLKIWKNCRPDSTNTTKMLSSLYKAGHFHWKEKRYAVAETILSGLIAIKKDHLQGLNLLAVTNSSLNKIGESQKIYEQIIGVRPDFVPAYVNLGNLQWRNELYEEAYVSWKMGLEEDSSNTYLKKWINRAELKLLESLWEEK